MIITTSETIGAIYPLPFYRSMRLATQKRSPPKPFSVFPMIPTLTKANSWNSANTAISVAPAINSEQVEKNLPAPGRNRATTKSSMDRDTTDTAMNCNAVKTTSASKCEGTTMEQSGHKIRNV